MFPAAVRRAHAPSGTDRDLAMVTTLHRICRVYAAIGIVVPVFGLAAASSLGVLGDAWLIMYDRDMTSIPSSATDRN
jgi:hypothetical protein